VLIAAIIGFCIVLLVLAFVFPRMSRHVQRAGDAPLGAGQRGASRVPVIGRLLAKPFGSSRKAVSKSGTAGRRGRGKLPI
jgi:hypothetical protein